MITEQREAIEFLEFYKQHCLKKEIENMDNYETIHDGDFVSKNLDTVLSIIKEQQEEIELIKEYAHQEIVNYTETIRDYIDDDKEGNKDYIGELKEDREHWKDIEKILQNKPKEELYMNWWRYGLYE